MILNSARVVSHRTTEVVVWKTDLSAAGGGAQSALSKHKCFGLPAVVPLWLRV
jgi:hypothetical protein